MSHRHVYVRSGVCVDRNGECYELSNRERVSKAVGDCYVCYAKALH